MARQYLPRRSTIVVVGVLVAALVASACSSGSAKKSASPSTTTTGSASTAAGSPKRGGTLTFGGFVAVSTLDPAVVAGTGTAGSNELAAVYGVLMRYDQTTQAFVPDMAQALDHNANLTVWTLKLRPNVTFTDGTPYDAAAVVTNIKRQMNPAYHSFTASDFSLVTSMATPDATTVVFNLSAPDAEFPFALSRKSGSIAAPSYLAKLDAKDTTATAVGAGPFTVQAFRPSDELDLTANPNYWAGAPYLAGLKFVWGDAASNTYQSFQAHDLQAALLHDFPSTAQAKQAHVAMNEELLGDGNVLHINQLPGAPLSNQTLRQAVAEAIDLSVLNEREYQGTGIADPTIIPLTSPLYSQSMTLVKYNPTDAAAKVAQVKASTGWNGTLRLDCPASPTDTNLETALDALFGPVGIKLNVTPGLTTAQSLQIYNVTHSYDLYCGGAGVPDAGLWTVISSFASCAADKAREGYCDPAMDSALGQLQLATTVDAKKAGLVTVSQVFAQSVPWIPLWVGDDDTIYANNVHGIGTSAQGVSFFDKAWMS
jgi:peptide/nickel transport system substrate-binding protein